MSNTDSKIWLSPPHMGGAEQEYVKQAFEQNWITSLGPNVNAFETSLEAYLGNDKKVAVLSSGTAALHLALLLLGVGKGDEVLCQSFTFAASVNPVLYVDATPIFIDSEPESWNICPGFLEEAIKDRINKGKKPAAIIAVHLYGMPYKHKEISEIASRYDIPVIEDAAEALGSSYNGIPCGTLGQVSVLSFNGNKIITTSGGGALVCSTAQQKADVIFLATQAKDDAPHYEHSTIGYNYRLSNVSAGIGRGQMEVLEQRVGQKQELNRLYRDFFSGIDGVEVFTDYKDSVKSNHWLTCVVLDQNKTPGKTAEGLRLWLEKDNIESRPLWKPMHLQPVFKQSIYYGADVAENLFKTGLCLPSGTGMDNMERERIFNSLSGYFS
nr:DegT/DnrJ/EryC1/StrS family aminotransferase [uncultured Flavobacterium sp.]